MPVTLLDSLTDWLRIPSVSTDGGDAAALRRAAAWVVQRIRDAGGDGRVAATAGNPLAVGELRACRSGAPTVLIYGHYDVQSPGPLDAWTSPPFTPTVRDGRLFARGAADDKGNFLPLLHVACELASAGSLPVNVRVLVEGEEEIGSAAVADWVRQDEPAADCAVVFDTAMVDEITPAITVALRGLVMVDVEVRTARSELHSGAYGGSALNALHVLLAMLAEVLPGPDGSLRHELRAGVAELSQAERASLARLPSGDAILAAAGAQPLHAAAGEEYHARTGADTCLDVHAITGGEPRTVLPSLATATLSQRLAPGQRASEIWASLEARLRAGAAAGSDVTLRANLSDPSRFSPDEPAIRLAAGALRRACGTAPLFVRGGGSIPVVAEFAARRIPTIVTGFVVDGDHPHAADESFRLAALDQGERASHELYDALAYLP